MTNRIQAVEGTAQKLKPCVAMQKLTAAQSIFMLGVCEKENDSEG